MILLILPEALIGASFQLSFAAVTAIVALHEVPWVRERLMRREAPWWAAFLRLLAGLLLTGIVVEAALAPIGLYPLNRMGAFGAFANTLALLPTPFVLSPLHAGGLLCYCPGPARPVGTQ